MVNVIQGKCYIRVGCGIIVTLYATLGKQAATGNVGDTLLYVHIVQITPNWKHLIIL